jgi:hypothetical protein
MIVFLNYFYFNFDNSHSQLWRVRGPDQHARIDALMSYKYFMHPTRTSYKYVTQTSFSEYNNKRHLACKEMLLHFPSCKIETYCGTTFLCFDDDVIFAFLSLIKEK